MFQARTTVVATEVHLNYEMGQHKPASNSARRVEVA
jgi:hypothetical protein